MSLIEIVYKRFVRKRIFVASESDSELAHEWGIRELQNLQNSRLKNWLANEFLTYSHPSLKTNFCGIDFPNPLGLAAGFDKYCKIYWRAIASCGWGFCEVGGITKYEQPGNDRPRMKRSEHYQAVWNFMGFNNPGADNAALTMSRNPTPSIPVGLNVGKSKITALEDAPEDYAYTIKRVWPYVDFITLNPSSPNTPGLRSLQNKEALKRLIMAAKDANNEMSLAPSNVEKKKLPIGVKISPDETDEQLHDIVQVCREEKINYIVATNTTVRREGLRGWDIPLDRGGVSGVPLAQAAERVLERLARELKGQIPIIGVGGISNGDDLYNRFLHGASLCQAYTAWPFEGPDFAKRCLKTLVKRLASDGYSNITQTIGAAL